MSRFPIPLPRSASHGSVVDDRPPDVSVTFFTPPPHPLSLGVSSLVTHSIPSPFHDTNSIRTMRGSATNGVHESGRFAFRNRIRIYIQINMQVLLCSSTFDASTYDTKHAQIRRTRIVHNAYSHSGEIGFLMSRPKVETLGLFQESTKL